jgi:hypothetical protein
MTISYIGCKGFLTSSDIYGPSFGKALFFPEGCMPRDLYEDLARIEDRGKRLKKADTDQSSENRRVRPAIRMATQRGTAPQGGTPGVNARPPDTGRSGSHPRPPVILSASQAAKPAAPVLKDSPGAILGGDNGGVIKGNRYQKRDIYEDLSNIEERGKRNKERQSLFGRRKD